MAEPRTLVDASALSVRDAAPTAHLLLHCEPSEAAAIAARVGLDLPQAMLRAGEHDGWHALHLAPDEWLLIGPPADADAMTARFAALGLPHSLVDITDRSLAVEVAGARAPDLLAAGCPLDLGAFPIGACTRTLFGKAMVMLWRTADAPAYRLEYARSFDGYVVGLLTLAAEDVG